MYAGPLVTPEILVLWMAAKSTPLDWQLCEIRRADQHGSSGREEFDEQRQHFEGIGDEMQHIWHQDAIKTLVSELGSGGLEIPIGHLDASSFRARRNHRIQRHPDDTHTLLNQRS